MQNMVNGTEKAVNVDVNDVVEKAFKSVDTYHRMAIEKRILFLENIADELTLSGHTFIAITSQETALPHKRLESEMQRTINQVKMFANLLKDGAWVNAIIDTAQPGRLPLPKPDTRQMQVPIGVVAVFGASNFPYAFSVAGGDTISALAAGCPVVYKAHPGHPETSRLMGELVQRAAISAGITGAVFSLIEESGYEVGVSLVQHPHIKAVAFTGSFTGGMALYEAAVERPDPIPVYAEMGSVNPVFILPGMMQENFAAIAKSLAASNTLSVGQFCTKPGIILSVQSRETNDFFEAFATPVGRLKADPMLTDKIFTSYKNGIATLRAKKEITLIARGEKGENENAATAYAFKVTGSSFLADKELYDELFGPFSLHVIAEDTEQLYALAQSFPGQLTCTVWANENDCEQHRPLIEILESKAGRLLLNSVPTGVEVTHAMVHGGPFPATTYPQYTSVGSQSVYRFTRPVCYQNFSQQLLPDALKNDNPLQLMRYINGGFTRAQVEGGN